MDLKPVTRGRGHDKLTRRSSVTAHLNQSHYVRLSIRFCLLVDKRHHMLGERVGEEEGIGR